MLFKSITLLFVLLFSTLCFYTTWSMLDDDEPKAITVLQEKTFGQNNFIFKVKTQDDITHIIVNFSLHNIHFTVISNNKNTSQYKTPSFDVVPNNIIKHASIAYKNNSTYTFYIAVKTSSGIFKQDTFVIKKIDLDTSTAKYIPPSCTDLFTHKSPIMHMSIVSQKDNNKDTNYLVVGSSYPSIKIYDLQNFKLVKTLHNRFLLGCTQNAIVYAKKNERPRTGIGRFIESRKENQSIECTLCYLNNSFDKKDEKLFNHKENNNNTAFQIDPAHYPLIADNNNMLAFFDTKSNFVYAIKQDSSKKDFALEKYHADIPLVKLNTNDNQSINKQEFRLKLKNLLENTNFYQYLNSFITMNLYNDFAEKNKYHDTSTTYDFLKYIFTNAIQKIFTPETIAETIAQKIIEDYEQILYQNEEKAKSELVKSNAFNLLEANDYSKIKLYWEKYASTAFQRSNYLVSKISIQLHTVNQFQFTDYSFTQIEPINNIYATENIIFLRQKNSIFGLDMQNNMSMFIPLQLTNQDENIKYIFQKNKNIFILTDKKLEQINLDSWQTQNKEKIDSYQQVNATIIKAKNTQEQLNKETKEKMKNGQETLTNIIDTIKSNETIDALQKIFREKNQFIVNTLDDVQDATRLDGIITAILKNNFIKPIVQEKIQEIVNSTNDLKENAQKQNLITYLTEQFTDINIWLQNTRVEEINGSIQLNMLIKRPGNVGLTTSDEVKTYIEELTNNKTATFKNTMQRFNSLKSELKTLKKLKDQKDYLNKLAILSYYLALEKHKITIDKNRKGDAITNQTYFAYAKTKIINNAKNIKNVRINIDSLHHKIYSPQSSV